MVAVVALASRWRGVESTKEICITHASSSSKRDTNNGESIVSYEFAERDLLHIRNVLGYLERSTDFVRQTEASAVVSLGYWRARVRSIQVMPHLPMHIDKQAKELLRRLDHLESTRKDDNAASTVKAEIKTQTKSQTKVQTKSQARSLASMV
jgi:hypothetical protein